MCASMFLMGTLEHLIWIECNTNKIHYYDDVLPPNVCPGEEGEGTGTGWAAVAGEMNLLSKLA